MDLFQPYMQLRIMSNAPIRTQKTTEHIHKVNGVGAVRATQSNSPELLKHPIQTSSGIHFVTSKIILKSYYTLYATNGIIQVQLIISFLFLYPIGRSITALYISNPDFDIIVSKCVYPSALVNAISYMLVLPVFLTRHSSIKVRRENDCKDKTQILKIKKK